VLALTATATEEVIDDIRAQLDAPRLHVVNTGIYRANLRYRVIQVTNAGEKQDEVLRLLRETPGVGIVYAATVKAVEDLTARLEELGASVTCYHGSWRRASAGSTRNCSAAASAASWWRRMRSAWASTSPTRVS
jgi:ATP-dependent DNA helicase RecQ